MESESCSVELRQQRLHARVNASVVNETLQKRRVRRGLVRRPCELASHHVRTSSSVAATAAANPTAVAGVVRSPMMAHGEGAGAHETPSGDIVKPGRQTHPVIAIDSATEWAGQAAQPPSAYRARAVPFMHGAQMPSPCDDSAAA